MVKSLADIRAAKSASLGERSVKVCLVPHLIAEVEALLEEQATLPRPTAPDEDGADGPPRRVGQGPSPRAREIQDRLAEVSREIEENEGELRVRGNLSEGEWRRWVDKHPAAAEGEPGFARDLEVTARYCDAGALIDHLGAFVHSWNGEELAEGDWDILAASIGPPDKKLIAHRVVEIYESRQDFTGLRSGLSAILTGLPASASPVTSGSVPDASTGGNLGSSVSATTETATV